MNIECSIRIKKVLDRDIEKVPVVDIPIFRIISNAKYKHLIDIKVNDAYFSVEASSILEAIRIVSDNQRLDKE